MALIFSKNSMFATLPEGKCMVCENDRITVYDKDGNPIAVTIGTMEIGDIVDNYNKHANVITV